ncbi:MAG: MgtC/SapB family protein [Hyphomicrobium sp.]|nr:MgtC/SapB family protein [Hyphomicrobium sp.]
MVVQPEEFETMTRLGTAVLLGGVVGLERDLRRMPTGMRTLALVCLGSCVAVLAAIKAGDSDGFSRVAQGIITGIGFLGGGVILQKGDLRDVKGLTTATAIWFTAAVGLLCGLGELKIAAFAVFLAVLVLAADLVLDPLFGKKHGKPPPHPDEKKSQTTSSGD